MVDTESYVKRFIEMVDRKEICYYETTRNAIVCLNITPSPLRLHASMSPIQNNMRFKNLIPNCVNHSKASCVFKYFFKKC